MGRSSYQSVAAPGVDLDSALEQRVQAEATRRLRFGPGLADSVGMEFSRFLWVPLAGYVAWLVFAYDFHFLDYVNLAFHEAGHVFLAPFGATLGILGGTVGQLFFPLACMRYFARQGQRSSALVCGVWLAESAMYVAHYMADARDMRLPLVGGEIHDWHWLLGRAGWLGACETLASSLHALAGIFAIAAVAALAWSLSATHTSASQISPARDSGSLKV